MASFVTQIMSAHEDGAIDRAVEHLIAGRLVAVPTETVYGLAADALNHVAVQHIFATKGRPAHNPLICHVSSIDMAQRFVDVTETAEKLMAHFWPGPLTLVLPRRQAAGIADGVSAGLDTLAVRCPAHDAARELIGKLGRPLAAPSANPSGKLSPTTAIDVRAGLDGQIPFILDGGQTNVGLESTIIGIEADKVTLLRPGTITAEELTNVCGRSIFDREDATITAPGQLKSHYAPNAAVRMNVVARNDDEILIGFGKNDGDLNLSKSGDLAEAARNLFSILRAADKRNKGTIAIVPIPNKGIGLAINDRLQRAAAPRDS